MSRRLPAPAALLVLAGGVLAPGIAAAQYFGRDKFQHRDFDFQVLETEHFDIHYYPDEKPNVEPEL